MKGNFKRERMGNNRRGVAHGRSVSGRREVMCDVERQEKEEENEKEKQKEKWRD